MNKLSTLFLALTICFSSGIFANNGDWIGVFTILDSKNQTTYISHSPTYVKVGFLQVQSYRFSKGVRLNGMVSSEDGFLTTDMTIEEFAMQVKKWGTVIRQEYYYGPTYTNARNPLTP